jgi:hypothetical protein
MNASITLAWPASTLPQPGRGSGIPNSTGRAGGSGHPDSIPETKLTLRVYNYAGVDPKSLARSEKVAATIFKNAGVEIVWLDCAPSAAQIQKYPACQSEMGTSDLVLRILTQGMAMKLRASAESLGFAQACPKEEAACELNVFYHRVDELATEGYRSDSVLGHVIAHEMTHVLLGPGHSYEGIMRREWSRLDLQRISWGMLLDFTKNQSSELRSAVLRRNVQY